MSALALTVLISGTIAFFGALGILTVAALSGVRWVAEHWLNRRERFANEAMRAHAHTYALVGQSDWDWPEWMGR